MNLAIFFFFLTPPVTCEHEHMCIRFRARKRWTDTDTNRQSRAHGGLKPLPSLQLSWSSQPSTGHRWFHFQSQPAWPLTWTGLLWQPSWMPSFFLLVEQAMQAVSLWFWSSLCSGASFLLDDHRSLWGSVSSLSVSVIFVLIGLLVYSAVVVLWTVWFRASASYERNSSSFHSPWKQWG